MKPQYPNSGKLVLTHIANLNDQIERMSELVLEHNANYIRESSGWRVDDILGFRFNIAHYNPLAGRKHRELPPFLANKEAIINVQNRDYRCFGYAVLAALEEIAVNPQRPQQDNQLFTGLIGSLTQWPSRMCLPSRTAAKPRSTCIPSKTTRVGPATPNTSRRRSSKRALICYIGKITMRGSNPSQRS